MKEIKRYKTPNLFPIQIVILIVVIGVPFLIDSKGILYFISHINIIMTGIVMLLIAVYFMWKKGRILTLLHENCHKKTANFLDYQTEIYLEEHYCYIYGKGKDKVIKKVDLQLIVLAPFVAELVIFSIFFIISYFISFMFIPIVTLFIITIHGTCADLYMVIVTVGHPKDSIYRLNREDKSFSLWKNNEAE